MRRRTWLGGTVGLMVVLAVAAQVQGQDILVADDEPASRELQEARLAQMLTGATLTGYFTVTGTDDTGPPRLRGERYDLEEVRKVDADHWLFKARIRYGDHDVTIPMTLPVEWAGDTPVVVVDNIGFPGLGTYSARVLFHRDHYAGHWSGATHGGHLFGTIQRPEPTEAPAE